MYFLYFIDNMYHFLHLKSMFGLKYLLKDAFSEMEELKTSPHAAPLRLILFNINTYRHLCTMCGICTLCVVKWVHVRSEVMCVLQYLGSGSWARPSGSRRSRRSEACNYWSPHGPLWGRYGSSDVCCSCSNAQEFIFFMMRFKTCVHHVMYASEPSTHYRTIFSVNSLGQQSHWRWREAMCAPGHTLQGHSSLLRPYCFPNSSGNKLGQKSAAPNVGYQFNHLKVLESVTLKMIVSLAETMKAIPLAKNVLLYPFLGPASRHISQCRFSIWHEHFWSR